MTQPLAFTVDPDDPRAPPQEVWDSMSAEERRRVVDMLPAEVPSDFERALEETRRLVEDERKRAEDERKRADEAERRAAALEAELERLRGSR
jgi:hypothetical protein